MRTRQASYWLQVFLLALLYCAVGRFSSVFFGNVAVVWPLSGLAVAALLLLGWELWPGLVLGQCAASLLSGWPTAAAVAAGAADALETLTAVYLLRWVGVRNSLDRLRDVMGLVLAAVAGPLLGATVSVPNSCWAGMHSWSDFASLWTVRLIAGSLSIVIVTPAFLTWAIPISTRRVSAAGGLAILVAVTGWAIGMLAGWSELGGLAAPPFRDVLGLRLPTLTPAILALPLLLWAWAALRFGPRGAAMATFLALSVVVGAHSRDFFTTGTIATTGLLAVQIFLSVLNLTSLGLAAAVAERTQVESELRRLASIVECSTDAIIGQSLDGMVTSWNRGAQEMFGYAASEVIGKPITLLLPPDRASVLAQVLERIERGERVDQYETIRLCKDGQQVAISLTTSTIKDAVGRIVGAATIARDITDRKRAEEKLRASEERYRLLFERNLAGVLLFTAEGRILDCNEAAAQILGYNSPEELVSRSAVDFFAADADRREFLARLREARVLSNEELSLRRRDGMPICVLANMTLLERRTNPSLLFGTLIDITERKGAEGALRESEARYRILVEHAPEAVVVYDVDHERFMEVNDNALKLFGLSREALLQKGPFELSPPTQADGRASADAAQQHIADALAGGTPRFEWLYRRADGGDVPCEVRLVRLPAANRRLVRGSITDITERQQLEEEVRQAHKLEAVGRLAGGVAHDFNNLLTAILGFNNLVADQLGPQHQAQGFLREIQKAADRAASLTGQLLAFSRRAMVQPISLDLNAVVLQTDKTLRRVLGEGLELATDLSAKRPTIKADPNQIVQVLLNLAVNARDAMPSGGRLTLATANIEFDERIARGRAGLEPGSYVLLQVSDTGCGMDASTLAHLFEPFFTTKGVGQGTGMGLATIYGIVKQSGGDIDVSSVPGQGTVFHIYFPHLEEPVTPPPVAVGGLPRGTETILVVEDEGSVRRLTCQILRRHGYTILEAANGEEALAVADGQTGAIDLVITDVVMPGMTGVELAKKLLCQRSALKVLFVSGYSEDILGQYGTSPETVLLRKPFSPEELVRLARRLLDEARL